MIRFLTKPACPAGLLLLATVTGLLSLGTRSASGQTPVGKEKPSSSLGKPASDKTRSGKTDSDKTDSDKRDSGKAEVESSTTDSKSGSVSRKSRSVAVKRIRAGLRKFRDGEFEEAKEAFEAASQALPGDARIAYNQACVAAAQGDSALAIKLFGRGALSENPDIAAGCHYNLGCVVAGLAKNSLGQNPANANPEQRQKGLEQLAQATRYYRQALRTQPRHEAARKNLELLRVWTKHIRQVWKERDKQLARDKMSLAEYLEHLQQQQQTLWDDTWKLKQMPESPHQRYGLRQLRRRQEEMLDEIEPLKQKLRQAFAPTPQPGTPNNNAPLSDQQQAALKQFLEFADETKSAIESTVDVLTPDDLELALKSQSQILTGVHRLYTVLAPFSHMLQRGIKHQEALLTTTKDKPDNSAEPATLLRHWAWQQQMISDWSDSLREAAKAGKAQLAKTDEPASDTDPPATDATQPAAQPAQTAALTKMYETAIELTPRIRQHSDRARVEMERGAFAAAHPEQEEALRLLKEIAKSQPDQDKKQDNKQENQQNDQQDQKKDQNNKQDNKQQKDPRDQDKQNQNKKKSGSDDQKKKQGEQEKNQKKKDEKKKDRDKKNKSKSAGEKKKDEGRGDDQKKKGQPSDQQKKMAGSLSQRQVEAILRRVREREQEHREMLRKLRRMTIGRGQTEKDW